VRKEAQVAKNGWGGHSEVRKGAAPDGAASLAK
jgi:hypothetical protein